jgi:acyl-coenzyme A thioesterase PaaI-like protein
MLFLVCVCTSLWGTLTFTEFAFGNTTHVHGGAIVTCLDEIGGQVLSHQFDLFCTPHMNITFIKPIVPFRVYDVHMASKSFTRNEHDTGWVCQAYLTLQNDSPHVHDPERNLCVRANLTFFVSDFPDKPHDIPYLHKL